MSSQKRREPAGAKHVAINSYPKIGGGIPVCEGRKNFHEKVMQACSSGIGVTLGEKIIVVGNHNVGKTSMMRRYVEDQYSDGYKATIGVDFMCQKYNILDVEFTLHIWDTAGQEQFKSVSRAYFRGASAVILAFDLGNPESLDNTREWLQDVMRVNVNMDMLVFLVGTKSDMFHAVDNETGQQVAAQLNAEYWECSSKTNVNLKELFERISVGLFENAVLRHVEATTRDNTQHHGPQVTHIPLNQYSDSVVDNNNNKVKKGCCG